MAHPAARHPAPANDRQVDRVTALERRLAQLERTAARAPSQAECDDQVREIETMARLVAERVVERTVETIKADTRHQLAHGETAVRLAVEGQLSGSKEATGALVRAAEQSLNARLGTALAELRSLVETKGIVPFAKNVTYPVGALAAHDGGLWQVVSRAGNAGEEPAPTAQSWALISDGVKSCIPRIDEKGDYTISIAMTSGKEMTFPLVGGTFRHRKGWSHGADYHINDVVVRDHSTYVALRRHVGVDPRDNDATTWSLLAARGPEGPGPSQRQMMAAEANVYDRLRNTDMRSRRERVEAIADEADDWLSFQRRPGPAQVEEFARRGIGEVIAQLAGEDARPDGDALADRVARSALDAARHEDASGNAISKAINAVRDTVVLLSGETRADNYLAMIDADPVGSAHQYALRAALRTLLGK